MAKTTAKSNRRTPGTRAASTSKRTTNVAVAADAGAGSAANSDASVIQKGYETSLGDLFKTFFLNSIDDQSTDEAAKRFAEGLKRLRQVAEKARQIVGQPISG
jgi:hypothetical protein